MNVAGGTGMVWGSIRREDERVYKDGRMLGTYIGPGESPTHATTPKSCCGAASGLPTQPTTIRPWCLYVGLVAPHFPLIVPQQFLDLYPLDSLPPLKLHPRDGYRHHPWVALQDAAAGR
jgi:choline-sulfatase